MKLTIILGITIAAFVVGTFADCHGGGCEEGFGTEPGKCGCCPWPCCCKCVEVAGDDCTTTTAEPDCVCVDLVFMVDGSISVSPFVWSLTLQWVYDIINKTMTKQEEIGCPDTLNMAMITFADNATLHWNLEPASAVLGDILNVPQDGRFTNIVEGMELAVNAVFSSSSDCLPFAVVLTDGRPNFRKGELAVMGEQMRAAVDGDLICIGITTNIDDGEMALICPWGYLGLSDQTQVVDDIMDAVVEAMYENMPEVVPVDCPAKEECFCCCSPDQYWGDRMMRY